ncbi:MAG: hypothetical protein HY782_02110 [Chloroflexi bacterium]|nr:hypothetical protein [Chloroflexota bacterium]
MLPFEIADALVVAGMFILRIGVPIGITLAAGYWLEKKLRPVETRKAETTRRLELLPRPRSAKIIQLHCWDFKHCDSTQRAQCAASKHPDLPCWLALQVEGAQVREECFTCNLYRTEEIAA